MAPTFNKLLESALENLSEAIILLNISSKFNAQHFLEITTQKNS